MSHVQWLSASIPHGTLLSCGHALGHPGNAGALIVPLSPHSKCTGLSVTLTFWQPHHGGLLPHIRAPGPRLCSGFSESLAQARAGAGWQSVQLAAVGNR